LVTSSQPPGDPLVPTAIGSGRGPGIAIAAVALVAIVTFGVLGRLGLGAAPPSPSPKPDASTAVASEAAVTVAGFHLVSPIAGTVWLRTTEIDVRGTAPSGVRTIEAVVRIAGARLGQATAEVDAAGRFDAVVPVIPPGRRTAATLEVREVGGTTRTLAEVAFAIEAGSLILIRDASALSATAGGQMVVDVLVYGRLREVRGLLTSRGGALLAETSRRLPGAGPAAGGPPKAIALELHLPADVPTGRAGLHVVAIDVDGTEVEHVDANVRLSSGR